MGKQLSTVTQQVREAGPSRNLQADVSALCHIFRPLHISSFLLPDKSQICLFSPLQFALQATAGVTLSPQARQCSAPDPSRTGCPPKGSRALSCGLPSGLLPLHRLGSAALVTAGHCGFLSAYSFTICLRPWMPHSKLTWQCRHGGQLTW